MTRDDVFLEVFLLFIQSFDYIIHPCCSVVIYDNISSCTLYEGYWIKCKRSIYWEVLSIIALKDGNLRIDINDHSRFYEEQQIF